MKITKQQILKMNKAVNRQIEIDNHSFFAHKVHKTKKDYNRQREKKVGYDY